MNQDLIRAGILGVMPQVRATGLLVSLFTARAPSGTMGATGAPSGEYSDVVGLVDIPCTSPPESVGSIRATEMRQVAEIAAAEFHHVLLDDYYPNLDNGWRDGWLCAIDGTLFNIKGVESDSQSQMTRVCVDRVTT